jgi:hypothetical protein
MLRGVYSKGPDVNKAARECLKNISSEDLLQLYYNYSDMADFEKKYQNVQGDSFENQLAKIMNRYKNEAKPDL